MPLLACDVSLLGPLDTERFTGWDERRKIGPNGVQRPQLLSQNRPKTGTLNRKDFISQMASNPYFSLAVLFLAALGFGLAPLALAWLWSRVFSPAKPNADQELHLRVRTGVKGRCLGAVPLRLLPVRHHLSIFDVEAVFLLPFAVAFTGLGAAACAAMLVFVLMLIEGLAWAWAKGVLTWA